MPPRQQQEGDVLRIFADLSRQMADIIKSPALGWFFDARR
jgi:hypothetical protein